MSDQENKDPKFVEINYILDIITSYQKEYVDFTKEGNRVIYAKNDVYDILDEVIDILIEATSFDDEEEVF